MYVNSVDVLHTMVVLICNLLDLLHMGTSWVHDSVQFTVQGCGLIFDIENPRLQCVHHLNLRMCVCVCAGWESFAAKSADSSVLSVVLPDSKKRREAAGSVTPLSTAKAAVTAPPPSAGRIGLDESGQWLWFCLTPCPQSNVRKLQCSMHVKTL